MPEGKCGDAGKRDSANYVFRPGYRVSHRGSAELGNGVENRAFVWPELMTAVSTPSENAAHRDTIRPMRTIGKVTITLLVGSAILVSGQEKPLSSDNKYYEEQLQALKENPIGNLRSEGVTQSYRLVWLRTFHHPVVVRIDVLPDGTGRVYIKETSGQGGYEPGKLIKNDARKLTAQQTQWFVDRMRESGFWELSSNERQAENEIVLDAATWVVEGKMGDQYHVVERYAPKCSDKVRNIGLMMLLDMAKLKLLYDEVY